MMGGDDAQARIPDSRAGVALRSQMILDAFPAE